MIATFLRELKEKGYAKETLRGYQRVLGVFEGRALTLEVIDRYQETLLGLKENTRRQYLLCLKRVLKAYYPEWEEGVVIPKKKKVLPPSLPDQERMKARLQEPDVSTFKGLRNKAILEVLYGTGIRRGELVNLKSEDIDFGKGVIRIEQGKGGKDRLVPIGKTPLAWLKKYVVEVRAYLKPKVNAVFLDRKGYRMHEGTPNKIVRRYGKESPHDYRHSFATHLLQNGMKETSLQRLLGHSHVSTTQVYTRVTIHDLQNMYRRTHPREKWGEN